MDGALRTGGSTQHRSTPAQPRHAQPRSSSGGSATKPDASVTKIRFHCGERDVGRAASSEPLAAEGSGGKADGSGEETGLASEAKKAPAQTRTAGLFPPCAPAGLRRHGKEVVGRLREHLPCQPPTGTGYWAPWRLGCHGHHSAHFTEED